MKWSVQMFKISTVPRHQLTTLVLILLYVNLSKATVGYTNGAKTGTVHQNRNFEESLFHSIELTSTILYTWLALTVRLICQTRERVSDEVNTCLTMAYYKHITLSPTN